MIPLKIKLKNYFSSCILKLKFVSLDIVKK